MLGSPYQSLRPGYAQAVGNAHAVISIERSLGVGIELAVQRFARDLGAQSVLSWLYLVSQIAVTWTVLVWLYARRRAAYALARNLVLETWAAALGVFALFPVAPPFAAGDSLPALAVDRHARMVYDGFAAMPSLHTACAVSVALAWWRAYRGSRVRWLGWAWVVVIVFTIVATGNHYVLDAVAGAVLTLLFYFGVERRDRLGRALRAARSWVRALQAR